MPLNRWSRGVKTKTLSQLETKQVDHALQRMDGTTAKRLKDAINAFGTAQFECGVLWSDNAADASWDGAYTRAQLAERQLVTIIYDIFKVRI